jgi:hypothetical protein
MSNNRTGNEYEWTLIDWTWRLNCDHPMFARVKYLCGMELSIATLFAQMFVVRHQMACCRFLCFPTGLVAFWNPQNPPAALLPYAKQSAAVPVKFHNCNDSVTRVARRLRVLTMHSKDILLQAKGGSSWLSPLRSDDSRDDQAGEAGPVEP